MIKNKLKHTVADVAGFARAKIKLMKMVQIWFFCLGFEDVCY